MTEAEAGVYNEAGTPWGVGLTPVIYLQTGDLKPGDSLAQDIFVGTQVLLRNGTLLQQPQIDRLRKLPLTSVAIMREDSVPASAAESYAPDLSMFNLPPVAMPALKDFSQGTTQTWLSNEYFSEPVPVPVDIPAAEKMFAQIKDALRDAAGLIPAVSSEQQEQLSRDLHASLISAAIKKNTDLDQLSDIADTLSKASTESPEGYLRFNDIQQYGQYLAGKAVNSALVLSRICPEEGRAGLTELTRALFAIAGLFAILPSLNDEDLAGHKQEDRETLGQSLLKYFEWLGSRNYASEDALQTAMLQFERTDGMGLPYGLSGDMIPKVSEAVAIASAYAARTLSQPKRPRQTPRQAADQMIAQSGKAFSGPGVNRFLRSMGYYPTGSLVELNNGDNALVVAQSERAMLKPIIRLTSEDGSLGEMLNLVEQPNMFIRRQVLEY